jgi:hypothetical protein
MRGGAVAGGRRRGRPPDGAHCSRRAGLHQYKSFVEWAGPVFSQFFFLKTRKGAIQFVSGVHLCVYYCSNTIKKANSFIRYTLRYKITHLQKMVMSTSTLSTSGPPRAGHLVQATSCARLCRQHRLNLKALHTVLQLRLDYIRLLPEFRRLAPPLRHPSGTPASPAACRPFFNLLSQQDTLPSFAEDLQVQDLQLVSGCRNHRNHPELALQVWKTSAKPQSSWWTNSVA